MFSFLYLISSNMHRPSYTIGLQTELDTFRFSNLDSILRKKVLHYVGQVPSVCVHIRFFGKTARSPLTSMRLLSLKSAARFDIKTEAGIRTTDSAVVFRAPERRNRGPSCRVFRTPSFHSNWCSIIFLHGDNNVATNY